MRVKHFSSSKNGNLFYIIDQIKVDINILTIYSYLYLYISIYLSILYGLRYSIYIFQFRNPQVAFYINCDPVIRDKVQDISTINTLVISFKGYLSKSFITILIIRFLIRISYNKVRKNYFSPTLSGQFQFVQHICLYLPKLHYQPETWCLAA